MRDNKNYPVNPLICSNCAYSSGKEVRGISDDNIEKYYCNYIMKTGVSKMSRRTEPVSYDRCEFFSEATEEGGKHYVKEASRNWATGGTLS